MLALELFLHRCGVHVQDVIKIVVGDHKNTHCGNYHKLLFSKGLLHQAHQVLRHMLGVTGNGAASIPPAGRYVNAKRAKTGLQREKIRATLAEVVDFRIEFADKDSESEQVIDFLEQLSPNQYVRKLATSNRRVKM